MNFALKTVLAMFAAAPMVACAQPVQAPPSVFPETNPGFALAGRWRANGSFAGLPSDGQPIEIAAPGTGSRTWSLRRVVPGMPKPVGGRGILYGDTLFVAWGDIGDVGHFAIAPDGNIECFYQSGKWFYEKGKRDDDYGDRFGGEWKLRGTTSEDEHYSSTLSLFKQGDGYTFMYRQGSAYSKGTGFVFGDRLAIASVDTYVKTNGYIATADGGYVVAAYKWNGMELVGSTMLGTTKPNAPPPKLLPELLTRGS